MSDWYLRMTSVEASCALRAEYTFAIHGVVVLIIEIVNEGRFLIVFNGWSNASRKEEGASRNKWSEWLVLLVACAHVLVLALAQANVLVRSLARHLQRLHPMDKIYSEASLHTTYSIQPYYLYIHPPLENSIAIL